MLEISAPAASTEAVVAAVQSGANSIYICFGGSGAGGFSQDALRKAIRYCRVRGVKVWAELDMLAQDGDIAAAESLAASAASMGADGFIVHDAGMLRAVRSAAPSLRLAAGERFNLHSLAGLEAVRQLGADRVILPRETPCKAIAELAAKAKTELCVTVFGESCVCRPGLCYMSALGGADSANRGVCPAPCRQRLNLGGKLDDMPMSLKDIDLLPHLPELEALGVSCVRIAPSVRGAEQVALCVGTAERCIREKRPPDSEEEHKLSVAFSGHGFTDGYYTGALDTIQGTRLPPDRADRRRALAEAYELYRDAELQRVPVKFYAVVRANRAARFGLEDGDGNRVTRDLPAPRSGGGRPLVEGDLRAAFTKLSGTPFVCEKVNIILGEGLTLPPGTLENVRDTLIKELCAKRAEPKAQRRGRSAAIPATKPRHGRLSVIFEVSNAQQLTASLAELLPDYLYLPLGLGASCADGIEAFRRAGTTPAVVLPPVIEDSELEETYSLLLRARAAGISQALVGNLGHIAVARMAGMDVRGDWGLNLTNSYSLGVAEEAGLVSATVSFELKLSQIKALAKPLDTELIAYGRLPVMTTDMCLIKNSAGRCACTSRQNISTAQGAVMPVFRERVCRNGVLSPAKVFLGDRRRELEDSGVWGVRLRFTTEGARECVETARGFAGRSGYRPNGLTRGLYY